MAARNPTSFTQWVDDSAFDPGKNIEETQPDNVLDDQVFCLDMQRLVVSTGTFGRGCAENGTVDYATSGDKFTLYCTAKHMCNVDTVSNDEIECDVWALVQTDNGSTDGSWQITSANAVANQTSTIAVSTSDTTPTWVQGDSINISTNGIEDSLTVAGVVDNNALPGDYIFLWALLIIAKET